PLMVGACAVSVSLFIIGVHAIMSGTAAADFGGRKATATASGISDGFVYLGSAVQSVAIGFLVGPKFEFAVNWPIFLIPFAVLGVYFATRMWKDLPSATRKYLSTVEKIDLEAPARRCRTSAIIEEPAGK